MNRTSSLKKGYIAMAYDTSVKMDFQYNPEQFTDNLAVEYKVIKSPGVSYPMYSYVGGDVRSVEFTLFVDGWENPKIVRDKIGWLHRLLPPANSNMQFKSPPICIFAFGWFVKKGILVSMPIRYTMFDRNLQPIRAEIDVTINIIQ